MSVIQPRGNSIIVDSPTGQDQPQQTTSPGNGLTSWLMAKADPWELHRISGYNKLWSEYWRTFRGEWDPVDKNRQSERSRLVPPAASQATEMTVAEIEEGLFSKEVWFDITDDILDEDKKDAVIARDFLREDLDRVNAKDVVSEATLNAAIFGTGIVKINTEVVEEGVPKREDGGALEASTEEKVTVFWDSVRPDEFIPDPAGRTVHEMLGCFIKVKKPAHVALEKIEQGIYLKSALPFINGQFNGNRNDVDYNDPQSATKASNTDEMEILEYHGKVPIHLLNAALEGGPEIQPVDSILNQAPDSGDGPMVEAIVTIANESTLLRAMINPFTMKDRSVIAFQFEKIPGRFWGRGVMEKARNPQKALQAEMRSRIDALGYVSAPMLGVDGGRVPRGFKMEVKPGKVWLTQGPPREVLQPVEIGAVNGNTFNQTQEMERMVQMATGAFDTASGIRSGGAGAASPQGQSMLMGAFVKRAKRSIRNVNDNLVKPLIKQTMWRYMQFAPTRYPKDFNFRVQATLGIVAKEIESMQMTQLVGMLPDEFPKVKVAIGKGVVDLSSIHNKAEIMQAMEADMAPPSEEEQQKQAELEQMQFTSLKAETQGKLLENQKTMAETKKLLMEAIKIQNESDQADVKVQIELGRLEAEMEQLEILRDQNRIALARVVIEEQRVKNEANRPKA